MFQMKIPVRAFYHDGKMRKMLLLPQGHIKASVKFSVSISNIRVTSGGLSLV